jgi:4'-phosphopantetheinyl transferase
MVYLCIFDEIKKHDRQRELAWKLLDAAVREEYGLNLADLQIEREEKGKPYSKTHPELHFNISHCETACACMVSDQACGIDVERRFPYREALAKKVCHAREWEALQYVAAEEREMQLRILWSLKESFVKRDGRGLGYGMDRIDLSKRMPFEMAGAAPELSLWWKHTERFTLAVCAQQQRTDVILKREQELG